MNRQLIRTRAHLLERQCERLKARREQLDGEEGALLDQAIAELESAIAMLRADWNAPAPVGDFPDHSLARQNENFPRNQVLEQVINHVPAGIAILMGADFRYSLANAQYLALARGRGSLIGRPTAEVWGDQIDRFLPALQRAFYNSETVQGVDQPLSIRRDGGQQDIFISYTLTPLRDTDGATIAVLVLAMETTEQVQTRRQIETEQARFKAVVATAPETILVVDESARLVFANAAAQQLYGHLPQIGADLTLGGLADMRRPDGSPIIPLDLPLVRAALFGESFTNFEMLVVHEDGSQRFIVANVAPFSSSQNQRSGAVAIVHDITERKREDEEMIKRAAQIELQHYLIQGREMERLQISQELHEGFLQDLIGVRYRIQQALDVDQKEERLNRMYGILATISDTTQNLRDYCYELRPPALVPFGVERALRSFTESFTRKYPSIQVTLELASDHQTLPQDVRVALFRIYQEVMNNVARHAGAKNVRVRFTLPGSSAELVVEDNGQGFVIPSNWLEVARSGHLGLAAAQERAEAVGGALTIESSAGQGTRVSVRVPVRPYNL